MLWLTSNLEHLRSCLAKPHKVWSLDISDPKTVRAEFLDDAEHRITAAKQYLLKYADHYQYISADLSVSRWQQGKIEFAEDISHAKAKEAVMALTDIRLIDTIVRAQFQTYALAWRDDEGKAVLKGQIYSTKQNEILVLQAIRGYSKANVWALSLLKQSGMVAEKAQVWQHILESCDYQPSALTQINAPELSPKQAAREAIFCMIVPMLKKARLNEEGIKTKSQDIEFLHEYRVSLRKARSLVSLFKDIFPEQDLTWFKQEMGDLGRKTNLLRDLDVYMQEQQAYEAMVPEALRSGIPLMFADFAKQHRTAKTSTKRWLSSKQYEQKISALQKAFAAPEDLADSGTSQQDIYSLVTDKLHKRYKKLVKLGRRITPTTPDDEVHELRIECKKFRYLMEFFAQLYKPKEVRILIKKLKKLQDTLGKFNDYSVQQVSLSAYLNQVNPPQAVTISVGALLGALAQKQLQQRRQVEVKFAEFADKQTAAMVAAFFPVSSTTQAGEQK